MPSILTDRFDLIGSIIWLNRSTWALYFVGHGRGFVFCCFTSERLIDFCCLSLSSTSPFRKQCCQVIPFSERQRSNKLMDGENGINFTLLFAISKMLTSFSTLFYSRDKKNRRYHSTANSGGLGTNWGKVLCIIGLFFIY